MDGPTGEPLGPELEIDDVELLAVARELQAYARDAAPTTPPGLTGRIQEVVSREPVPSPLADLAHALAPSGWAALPTTVRRVARLAAGVGRPTAGVGGPTARLGRLSAGVSGPTARLGRPATVALRAQALAALLILALLALGGGSALVVGAQAVLRAVSNPPSQSVPPSRTNLPGPSATATPIPIVGPGQASPGPTSVPAPEPSASPHAGPPRSGEPVESTASPATSRRPSPAPVPTSRPGTEPRESAEPSASAGSGATPEPGESPAPGDTAGGTGTPQPGDTAQPTHPPASATPGTEPGDTPSPSPSKSPGGD